ncbi:MAG: hypothetical protein MK212_06570 [Saprospiraceae bacterium]|nr:hypothetical protein [Saprospiraceae bacterium]
MAIVDNNGNPVENKEGDISYSVTKPKSRHPLSLVFITLGGIVGILGVLIFFVPIFAMVGGFIDPIDALLSINSYWWGFWMMLFGGLGAALGLLFGTPKLNHSIDATSRTVSRKEQETTYILCWKCNSKNDKKATYCSNCGIKLL